MRSARFADDIAHAFMTCQATMHRTVDTYTGRPFRWNNVVFFQGLYVPDRCLKRSDMWLHPSRTPRPLLVELNSEEAVAAWEEAYMHR